MINAMNFRQPLVLGTLSADPSSPVNGVIYYNSSSNVIRVYQNGSWVSLGTGSGTVTSVALADGSTTPIYTISGSPVSTSGTLTFTLNSQTANFVFAAPNGSAGQPGFRALVAGDLPALSYANEQLSNLSGTVAINLSLLPGTDNSINLGSASKSWTSANIHTLLDGSSDTSVDAYNRALVDTSAATQLSWSTSGVEFNQLTATTVPYLNSSKVLTSSAVTPTQLGYLSGASGTTGTGNLVYSASPTFSGTLVAAAMSLSSALNMNSNQINNLASPSLSTDAATKGYVDSAINGLTWKGPVNAFSNTNVALTGGATLTIDGYSVQNGNYVILSNQTTASQNYVYVASGIGTAYTLTEVTGSEAPTALGDAYLILDGTTYGNTAYQVNQISPNVTFIQFAGPNTYTFTTPLSLTGNTVSVGYDNSTIGDNGSNQLYVKNGGIGTTQLAAQSVTYAKIQAETASTLLGNSTGSSASPSEITLGATLAFSGSALETDALTGDVTSSANSFATTVAKIQGTTVSGTTGSGDVVFSASPTLTGTVTAAAANFSGAVGANDGITSTGALTIDANGGSSAVQMQASTFQRSTDGASFITQTYVDSTTLADNTSSPTTAFSFASSSYVGVRIEYIIKTGASPSNTRIGTLMVACNSDGSSPTITDQFDESADAGVTWSVANSSGTINIQFTSTNQGSARTVRGDFKYFRA